MRETRYFFVWEFHLPNHSKPSAGVRFGLVLFVPLREMGRISMKILPMWFQKQKQKKKTAEALGSERESPRFRGD